MSAKTKIIILICVYLAGYFTALKVKPEPPPPLEIVNDDTQKATAKKVTKKYAPSGSLESETSEELSLFLSKKLSAKVPPQIIYKRDAVTIDADSSVRVGVFVRPYTLLPVKYVPENLHIGYAKDLRTGEDIYRAAYTVFTKE
jgi:hypothetical protein